MLFKKRNTYKDRITPMKMIINYFLQGLLLIAPISITLYVVYLLFEFVDGLLPLKIPGLGVVIIFSSITFIGFAGSVLIKTPFSRFFNRMLERVPIIKIVYSSISDLLSAFVGQKRKFTEPVMVVLSKESNIRKLGFITEKDLHSLGISNEFVAVYLPHSYNFSGNMFIVPAENLVPIEANSAEFMKFIVSGGVTKV
ncbi:MAG: DUF502 domain-containing protein [Bacteroidota bacterium]